MMEKIQATIEGILFAAGDPVEIAEKAEEAAETVEPPQVTYHSQGR